MMDTALRKIASQNYACIVTGDVNIDLLQWNAREPIRHYLVTATRNTFTPLLVLQTRVTFKSSTLIDYSPIYY